MNGFADFHRWTKIYYPLIRLRSCRVALVIFIFITLRSSLFAEPLESTVPDSALFGKVIRSIDYSSDPPLDRSHYDPYLGIKLGDVLTRTGVKEAIQFLYSCGRFSHVSVDGAPDGDAVNLRFILRQNYYFNKFFLEGDVNLKGRSLWEWVSLPIGQHFTEEKLEESRKAILGFIVERGFYQAQVKARTSVDEANRQVDTVFAVQPGTLATIRSIEVTGMPSSGAEEATRYFGFRKGRKYDRSKLNSHLDNVRKHFLKKGFLAAVAQVSESFDSGNNTIALVLAVNNYGKIKVVVEGYKIEKDQLRRLLPMLTGEGINREILDEGLTNLKEHLENKGYSEAEIRISETTEKSGVRVIHYGIVPSRKFLVSYIRFKDNRALSAQEMLASLEIQRKTLFQNSAYSAARLDDDVASLKSLYASRGYLEARVIPLLEPLDQGKRLGITYLCEEGALSRIQSLNIIGNEALPTADLNAKVRLAPGKPYSPSLVEQGRQALLAAYNDQGYLWTQVAVRVSAPDQAHTYPVEYQIREGIQTIVERILVLGNEKTRDSIIKKRIKLKENEPLSLSKLLQTQKSLYGLGVFDQVRVSQQNSENPTPFQDVVVRFQESRRFTIRYGLGYQEREKLRGTLEFTHLNTFGLARRAQIRFRGSSIEQQALFTLQQPQFRAIPVDSYFTFSFQRKKDVSFDSNRFNLSYQFSHPFGNHSWGMLRYNFKNVHILHSQIPESDLGREDTPANFSTFSAAFVNDTRDDYLDPSKGFFSSSDFGVTPRTVSSRGFLSFFSQNSYYRPLPKSFQIAASVRVGLAHSLELDPDLPISERFFAGGSSSLRGFDTDYAGPLASGSKPLGGNALIVGSMELRIPVFRFIRFAGFYDTGNVFRTISDVNARGFSHTLGGGLRIKTPFGPLRADYGYNLNLSSDRIDRGLKRGHFFITVGPPF
jgi:outer membrane protein insertion porin family